MASAPDYFKNGYGRDIAVFTRTVPHSYLCGWTLNWLLEPGVEKSFHDLGGMVMCLYEANLLYQLIYTHFRCDYLEWLAASPTFIDCRCPSCHGGVFYPVGILNFFANKQDKERLRELDFTTERLAEFDDFFQDEYIGRFAAERDVLMVTPERVREAIAGDPHCAWNPPLPSRRVGES